MRINNNIWTGIEYRRCLLFKRFYAAGLAWLSQGPGTKVLAWNKENRNRVTRLYVKDKRIRVTRLYVKDKRIMVTWGQISMKQGCRNKGWNKGNRDEWRGVRDVMEIEWTWRWRRYSRGEVVWDGLCQRSIRDPISNRYGFLDGYCSHGCGLRPIAGLPSNILVLYQQCTNSYWEKLSCCIIMDHLWGDHGLK